MRFRHFTKPFERGPGNSLKPVRIRPFSELPVLASAKPEKTWTYSNLIRARDLESARFTEICSFPLKYDRFACLPPGNGSGLFHFREVPAPGAYFSNFREIASSGPWLTTF